MTTSHTARTADQPAPPAASPVPTGPAAGPAAGERAALAALVIRRLTVADLSDCLDLADDRDWPREEAKWRLLLSAGQGFGVDAPDGRGLIASAVATPYSGIDGGPAISALSMVLVARRYARRGLGLRLMRHVVAEEHGSGATATFLTATEHGRPLYERLGFAAVGSLIMLRGHFVAGAEPGAVAGAADVRPATAADLPAVLAYDRRVFGADRTGLLTRLPSYADQFLVAESPGTGRLTGYAAAWPNVDSTVIGPVLAEDPAIALALVARLATDAPVGTPLRFDADVRQPEPASWLRARGLAAGGSPITVMVRGLPDLPGDAARRFAPYSVALG